ncbi:MAG: LysM peptidoglycan-binding domain-containing protein [Bacteroidia bacterium]|nr:MAG: LysM peptidoglycan-binding domain-containing protein [Bacteroidia bacterium]
MDMKKIVISAGLVLSVMFGYAQAKSVISIKNKKLSFQHTVAAKETLTGIAKLYNISLAEISKENSFEKNTELKIGQKIKVTVPVSTINQKRKTSSPLYYTVDSKESLSQVSKKFNNVSIANLKNWNDLKSDKIDDVDKLIIGYLAGTAVKDDAKKDAGKNIMAQKNTGERKVKVNVESTLNIRKGPDAEFGIVAVAKKDEELTFIKQLNSDWAFVRNADGVEGFTMSQFLINVNEKATSKPSSSTKKEAAEKGKEMKVLGTTINVRKGPSTNDEVIATAAQEENLTVLKNVNKDWVKVRLKDGTEGYAAAQFIGDLNAKIEKQVVKEEEKGKEMKVMGTTINIRKGPSTNDEVIATAAQEERIIVLKSINKEWSKVKLKDGTEGYAAAQFIGELNAKIDVPKPAVNTEKQVKVIGSLLNIRKGAGTEHEIVAQAKLDEEVAIVKEVNKEWVEVKTADGKEGFAASLYLDLPGNREKLAAQQAALAAAALEQAKADEAAKAKEKEQVEEVKEAVAPSKPLNKHYFESQYKRGNHTKVVNASYFKTDIGWNDGGKYYID